MDNRPPVNPVAITALVVALVVLILVVFFTPRMIVTVPAGHVAVADYFGQVVEDAYGEGLHFPVNPMYDWTMYDARQKTVKQTAGVPSQDQLITQMDVSVQYRVIASMAPTIKQETGSVDQLLAVHLEPTLRGLLRDAGKTIERAEDFFQEQTVEQLKIMLETGLRERLNPKGLEVQAVFIRDIQLPAYIAEAVQKKKEREQAAEQQKAELERYRTEQMQKVAQAEAEQQAAELEAKKLKTLAEAKAFEIETINAALSDSPAYVQLQALEALKSISKDPAAKMYFMDGSSPTPLPLMHMGDFERIQGPRTRQ